jgi:hypothetical protein
MDNFIVLHPPFSTSIYSDNPIYVNNGHYSLMDIINIRYTLYMSF